MPHHLGAALSVLKRFEPSEMEYLGDVSILKAGVVSLVLLGTTRATGWDNLLWAPAGIIFLALLALMSGSLLTEYHSLAPAEKRAFVWEREITGKFLLIALVVLSLILDVVVYVVASVLPGNFPLLQSGYLFITFTTMLWLVAAEVTRITRNISHVEGDESIPPTIGVLVKQMRWVLKSLRVIDMKRAEAAGVKIEEKKEGRWSDDLSDEEVEALAGFIEARRKMKSPPVPEVILTKEVESAE